MDITKYLHATRIQLPDGRTIPIHNIGSNEADTPPNTKLVINGTWWGFLPTVLGLSEDEMTVVVLPVGGSGG